MKAVAVEYDIRYVVQTTCASGCSHHDPGEWHDRSSNSWQVPAGEKEDHIKDTAVRMAVGLAQNWPDSEYRVIRRVTPIAKPVEFVIFQSSKPRETADLVGALVRSIEEARQANAMNRRDLK